MEYVHSLQERVSIMKSIYYIIGGIALLGGAYIIYKYLPKPSTNNTINTVSSISINTASSISVNTVSSSTVNTGSNFIINRYIANHENILFNTATINNTTPVNEQPKTISLNFGSITIKKVNQFNIGYILNYSAWGVSDNVTVYSPIYLKSFSQVISYYAQQNYNYYNRLLEAIKGGDVVVQCNQKEPPVYYTGKSVQTLSAICNTWNGGTKAVLSANDIKNIKVTITLPDGSTYTNTWEDITQKMFEDANKILEVANGSVQ